MYDDLQPVSIAGLEFDALLNETKKLTATIPTYTVEEGFSVSDAIINEPITLSLTLYVTNTPVTWLDEHGEDEERIREVIDRLEEIWEEKELVKIVTTNAIYTDMGITSISIAHQEGDGYARRISIEAQKVYQTSRETTLIPSSSSMSGESGASGGSANTSEATEEEDASAYTNIWNAVKSASKGSSQETTSTGKKNYFEWRVGLNDDPDALLSSWANNSSKTTHVSSRGTIHGGGDSNGRTF